MDSNNVVPFPKPYSGPAVPSLEEVLQNTDMMKQFHIQETITSILPMIFTQLDIAGFEFDSEEEAASLDSLKEGAFLVEALRALMCRHYGIYHPFQEIWDNVFIYDDSGPEPILKIVDGLNFKFHKKENVK